MSSFTRVNKSMQIIGQVIVLLALLSRLAQATTTARLTTKTSSPVSSWSGELATGLSRGMVEQSNYYWTVGTALSYKINKRSSLSAKLDFATPVDDRDLKVFDDDLKYNGLEDLMLVYDHAMIKTKTSQFNFFITGALPTSRTSQKASLYGSVSPGVSYGAKLSSIFSWSTTHSLSLATYKYETADMFGSASNYPFALSDSLGAKINFLDNLALTGSYAYSSIQNYLHRTKNINSFSTSLVFNFSNGFGLSAFYSWKDATLTNNSLFDSNNSLLGAGISYDF